MKVNRKPKLKMYADGHRHFVHVPAEHTAAVRTHLQSHGIGLHHAEQVMPGLSSIEMHAGADQKAIQMLLNEWSKSPPA